jgi:NADH dehydrogenase (ubiquinone) 1 alpha subcomplex subunit 6
MATIPARLAKKVHIASTLAEARSLSIDAYRAWYRAAPEICALYALNVSPSAIRLKIREDFERNRNIENLDVINLLLHKNQQEFQETMNCWKQEVSGMSGWLRLAPPLSGEWMRCQQHAAALGGTWITSGRVRRSPRSALAYISQPHLLHWFKKYEDPAPPKTFLDKFLAGRDEPNQVASF